MYSTINFRIHFLLTQVRVEFPEYFAPGHLCLLCILSTDGMCPFKDKKKISLWPVILILMNLPEAMRYDPRNIIILYIAASAAGGQPKNFHPHLSMVVDELINSAAGHDMLVGGVQTRVHVVVPVLSADGRGPLMCVQFR